MLPVEAGAYSGFELKRVTEGHEVQGPKADVSGGGVLGKGLQHGLQLIMARRYTRIINCRPCCNLYVNVAHIEISRLPRRDFLLFNPFCAVIDLITYSA